MIIAIDGPAGSGKSTIAKSISKKLNIEYLDTGALYRGVTLILNRNKLSLMEEEKVVELLNNTSFSFKDNMLYIDGILVEEDIRKNEISKGVSSVASTPYIRSLLTDIERRIGKSSSAILMDGRDIGSVVFPDADIKIFLTASIEVRALRRHKELMEKGEVHTLEDIREDIKKRDYLDINREVSPLVKSPDAIEIITDNYTIEEVTNIILNIIHEKCLIN